MRIGSRIRIWKEEEQHTSSVCGVVFVKVSVHGSRCEMMRMIMITIDNDD